MVTPAILRLVTQLTVNQHRSQDYKNWGPSKRARAVPVQGYLGNNDANSYPEIVSPRVVKASKYSSNTNYMQLYRIVRT